MDRSDALAAAGEVGDTAFSGASPTFTCRVLSNISRCSARTGIIPETEWTQPVDPRGAAVWSSDSRAFFREELHAGRLPLRPDAGPHGKIARACFAEFDKEQ